MFSSPSRLLTDEQRTLMLANGACTAGGAEVDYAPVVKLFTPDAQCTWLLTELDPVDPDIAFGLCDLGMGFPELGCVRISELQRVRGPMGLRVERDLYFAPDRTLSQYADAARKTGYIQT